MIVAPKLFARRPPKKEKAPLLRAVKLPDGELRPSNLQALLAAHEEASALLTLEQGALDPIIDDISIVKPVDAGVQVVLHLNEHGHVLGRSTVYGMSDEEP